MEIGCCNGAPQRRRRARSANVRRKCSCSGPRWSKPDKDGRSLNFCSVCGSRAQSRMRLSNMAQALKQQVELMQEIATCQAQAIAEKVSEKVSIQTTLTQRAALVTSMPLTVPPALTQEINLEKEKVERYRREISVWHAGSLVSQKYNPDTEQADNAQREAECKQWELEYNMLKSKLADVQKRSRQLINAPVPKLQNEVHTEESLATNATILHLQREVDVERQAVMLARQRLNVAHQEIEEEQRAQADAALRRPVTGTASSIGHHFDVEGELFQSQSVQLQSVKDTVEILKAHLQQAQKENSELKVSLKRNMKTLRNLRSTAMATVTSWPQH